MKSRLYITIVLLSTLLYMGCGVERNIKNGEKHLAIGEYYDAAEQFRQAYQKTSPKDKQQRGKVALKMARCYARINQHQRAIGAYRNAVRYGQAGMEDRVDLGRQLLKAGAYKEAAGEFQMVLDSVPDHKLAKSGLASALSAPRIKEQGSRYKVRRMDVFNSRRDDYSPMLGGDGFDRLYFTSTRNEAEGDEQCQRPHNLRARQVLKRILSIPSCHSL